LKNYQILTEIYNRSRGHAEGSEFGPDNRTCLQHFLDLEKNHGMSGVSRSIFEERWNQAVKYPVQTKLEVITARQQDLINDVVDAMLRCDPPWEEVIEWAEMAKAAKENPRGLPDALTALSTYTNVNELRDRCVAEFPQIFKPESDA
jgi:hypothetical protein